MNTRWAFASAAIVIASSIGCGCSAKVNHHDDSTDINSRIIVNPGSNNITPDKNIITKTGKCRGIDEIEASTAIKVLYIESNNEEYIVAAPSNVMPYVECEFKGGDLEIGFKNSPGFKGNPNVTLTVYAPSLKKVELNGASSFQSTRITNPNGNMELELSGASSLSLENIVLNKLDLDLNGASSAAVTALKVSVLEAELSGASSADLKGTADYANFDVNGASSLSAKKLTVDKGNVECSGASNAAVNIKSTMQYESSGMSKLSNSAK